MRNRKLVTVLGVAALSVGMLAGPASAELKDDGNLTAVESSCTEAGGAWGTDTDGNYTCTFDASEDLQNNDAVEVLKTDVTTYTHDTTDESTNPGGQTFIEGEWDEGESTSGVCVTLKKGAKVQETICSGK
ncbi:hypothetical protein [Nitriliruptor alkaliphilus]|uniref:hypothetical protein n=1 Tax=Nitriliruptor alkaliphilus TaxID=427918 RepID=UPI000698EE93|nr:hypothetical protein [Nitriliruptor alkaliphilus]